MKRPQILEADVVRFQNNKEKWIAFVGLVNGQSLKFLQVWQMMKRNYASTLGK